MLTVSYRGQTPKSDRMHANRAQRNSGTLKKELLWLFLELIPEWKSPTLLGPALIDCTLTIYAVKKTAEMLAIYNALLQ